MDLAAAAAALTVIGSAGGMTGVANAEEWLDALAELQSGSFNVAEPAGDMGSAHIGEDSYPGVPDGLDWSRDPVADLDKWLFPSMLNNFYTPIHDAVEDWIGHSQPLLNVLNQPFVELLGRDLIGNGIQVGTVDPATGEIFDGTNHSMLIEGLGLGKIADFGSLHDGGFLFGDGAAGSAGGTENNPSNAGLDGGGGGIFGNGGAGGAGIDGSPGGEGGMGGWLMGNGGAGGAGGGGGPGYSGGSGASGGPAFIFGNGGGGGAGGAGGVGTAGLGGGNGGSGGTGGLAGFLIGFAGDGGAGGSGGDGLSGGNGGLGGQGGLGGFLNFAPHGLGGVGGNGGDADPGGHPGLAGLGGGSGYNHQAATGSDGTVRPTS